MHERDAELRQCWRETERSSDPQSGPFIAFFLFVKGCFVAFFCAREEKLSVVAEKAMEEAMETRTLADALARGSPDPFTETNDWPKK